MPAKMEISAGAGESVPEMVPLPGGDRLFALKSRLPAPQGREPLRHSTPVHAPEAHGRGVVFF
jgi:hypothetical protein